METLTETPIITFDEQNKDRVLSSLGFKEDKRGRLVNEKGTLLTDLDFEPVLAKDFGGALRGSKVIVKKDKSDLVKYFISKKK